MKSEEMGFLIPNLSTEFIEMGVNGTENSRLVGGNWVKDNLSTANQTARNLLYNNSEKFEFFLVHNYTASQNIIEQMQKEKYDGIIGLSPNLGSGKKTYA